MAEQREVRMSEAERVRVACLEAAMQAFEDAGIRGLCAEGRWEAAVDAIRQVDVSALTHPRAEGRKEAAMSDTTHTPHRRRHAVPSSGPYIELDLERELEELRREPEWTSGHNAKTLVKHETLRLVLTALKAGARIPEHQTDGRISIQTVQGRVLVRADGRTFDLPAGTLLVLDQGLRHDVEAVEDSGFLLTIAWPDSRGDARG